MTANPLRIRHPELHRRAVLTWIILGAFVVAVARIDVNDGSGGILRLRGLAAVGEIALAAFRPDLSPAFLCTALGDSVTTLGFAVAGMTMAVVLGMPAAVMASGVVFESTVTKRVVVPATRLILAWLRSMHELVWALLFVAALGLTPWAGILAIGISYAGAIGRVMGERFQDVPSGLLAALRSAGASPMQRLLYGRLPYGAADTIGYLSYRFECAVRSAAILTFVGLGGIGFRIEIALADLRFDRVWTMVYVLVAIIVAVDAVATALRRRVA